jgi:hypothetical protein
MSLRTALVVFLLAAPAIAQPTSADRAQILKLVDANAAQYKQVANGSKADLPVSRSPAFDNPALQNRRPSALNKQIRTSHTGKSGLKSSI